MTERKIIQIAATKSPEADEDNLFALCDDGTLWHYLNLNDGEPATWVRCRPVPQYEVEEFDE